MGAVKVVRVAMSDGVRWGVVEGGVVHALAAPPWSGAPEPGARLGDLADLTLLAPAAPTKIVCVGRNYAEHAAEHAAEVPSRPLLFLKPPSAVIGHRGSVALPPESDRVEHEGELAVVIGRRCRRVDASRAWAFVAGVTCANDVTARDLQRSDGQWTRGKGFDTFCPLGPWLVVGLAEQDLADRGITCRVNGRERQRGRTSEMVFPPPELVAAASAVMTLEPGDVLLTGTPAGVGPLRPGDDVEVEIEGVGVLANPVVAEEVR
jgi:2-keto-4-pentenoate hydratase/2-oxohepta-3-ene-1,7-dioic acid hydratase in catechol pathway